MKSTIFLSISILISLFCLKLEAATTASFYEYDCRVWMNDAPTGKSVVAKIGRFNDQAQARLGEINAERLPHSDPQKTKWGMYQIVSSGVPLGKKSAIGFEIQPDLMDGMDLGWIYPLYLAPNSEKVALSCFRKD